MKNEYYEDWDSDEEIQFVQMINNQYHEWGIYSPYWALVTAFKIASHSFCMFLLLGTIITIRNLVVPTLACYIEGVIQVFDKSLWFAFFVFILAYFTVKIYQRIVLPEKYRNTPSIKQFYI